MKKSDDPFDEKNADCGGGEASKCMKNAGIYKANADFIIFYLKEFV